MWVTGSLAFLLSNEYSLVRTCDLHSERKELIALSLAVLDPLKVTLTSGHVCRCRCLYVCVLSSIDTAVGHTL